MIHIMPCYRQGLEPVNKEVYEEWKKGWADEPTTDDDKVYELGEDYEEKESILAFEICR